MSLLTRELVQKCKHTILTNKNVRIVLVDWMSEVCGQFHLRSQTFHNSVNILDRFLHEDVPLSDYQLAATAAMFISSKLLEITPPKLKDFVTVTNNTYTKDRLIAMEASILRALSWRVQPATVYDFVASWLEQEELGPIMNLLDTMAMHPLYGQHLPSEIASSAMSILHPGRVKGKVQACIDVMRTFLELPVLEKTYVQSLEEYNIYPTDLQSLHKYNKGMKHLHARLNQNGNKAVVPA